MKFCTVNYCVNSKEGSSIMKKFFLSMYVCLLLYMTNFMFGDIRTLKEALEAINTEASRKPIPPKNISKIAPLAKAILRSVIDLKSEDDIATLVEYVIKAARVALMEKDENYKWEYYSKIFNYFDPLFNTINDLELEDPTEESCFEACLLKHFLGPEEEVAGAKMNLRAFRFSLCWNVAFWGLMPIHMDKQFEDAKKIIKHIYAQATFDEFSLNVFIKSFEAILGKKLEPTDNLLVPFLKEIAKEHEISCKFLKDEKQKNVPQDPPANNQEEEKNEIPQPKPNVIPINTEKPFPLIPVGIVLGAAGGSYYVVEKTEYGKRLKKFEQENPKTAKALKVLAAMTVSGVVYKLVNN